MKKATLILGPPQSGKSKKVIELIEQEGYQHPVFINEQEIIGSLQYKLNQDTDVVIIDDCPRNMDYEPYYNDISRGVHISPKGEETTMIQPAFIFTSCYRPLTIGASFDYRFDIIELDTTEDEIMLESSLYDDIPHLTLEVFDAGYLIRKTANRIVIGVDEESSYELTFTEIIREMRFYEWELKSMKRCYEYDLYTFINRN